MPKAEFLHLPIVRATEALEVRIGRDARFHLVVAVFGSVILLLNQQLLFQLSCFLLLLLALFYWRIPATKIAHALLPVLVMMSLTIVYHLLFFDFRDANYGARPILYSPPLDRGLFYAFRLGGLYLLIIQLVRAVPTDALADAIITLIWPLRHFGIPVVPIVLALRAGLSSIPVVTHTMKEFEQSLKMSGVHSPRSRFTLLSRVKLFPRLFAPMLVVVARRADQLVLAIRARGYQSGNKMTRLSSLRWTLRDTIDVAMFMFVVTFLWRCTA